MAKILSSPTTINVVSSGNTALAQAAAALGSNTFAVFEQPSLSERIAHPTSGILCDVTEDGAQYRGHTAIDWAGKGCYDPVSKRVMWASCGAGNNFAGGYVYNTHAIYNELTNTWSALRGFQSPNESNTNPIVHMYDGNAIDVVGRKFYRKKFTASEIMVYDLVTNRWVNAIPSPPTEPGYSRDAGIDIIPTRGAAGAIWLRTIRSGDNAECVFEYDIQSGVWSVLKAGGTFGSGTQNNSPISYNPRAFGGAGGVLFGANNSGVTIRADNMVHAMTAAPPAPLSCRFDGHLCRDPVGDGWFLAADNGYMYRCNGSTWTQLVRLPAQLGVENHNLPLVMVPIDAYGVIWLISSNRSTNRAWLYKP